MILSKINKLLDYGRVPNLEKSQWWNYEQLLSFQNKRLRKIVNYAYENIPGHRAKFIENRVKPNDVQTVDDLYKLPTTTREEIQENDRFVNKKLITGTLYTGGSTGTTLKYFESKESGMIRWLAHLRGWRWNGYEHGSKRIAVISSAQGIVGGENTLNLHGDLTEKNLAVNISKINEFRPQHLRGYVSSIYIMAKYCLDNNMTIDGIESINVIAETLYDHQREVIEKCFKCKVYEEYCCNDGGASAWECGAHNDLHYTMERAIIEEVGGEMIVTDLWNKAMPFIRYRNGDAVKFLDEKCRCGRALPLISVQGRTNDILLTPNGPISPVFLMHHGSGQVGIDKRMGDFRSGIRCVQYIQDSGYRLKVNLVKNKWCSSKEIEEFLTTLDEIAPGMHIDLQVVDELMTTEKGKRQFIVNNDKELLRKWGYEY